jgi:hypothetical protein
VRIRLQLEARQPAKGGEAIEESPWHHPLNNAPIKDLKRPEFEQHMGSVVLKGFYLQHSIDVSPLNQASLLEDMHSTSSWKQRFRSWHDAYESFTSRYLHL